MVSHYLRMNDVLLALPEPLRKQLLQWFDLKSKDVAQGTIRSIQYDFVHFFQYCKSEQELWLPTSKTTLRRYVQRYNVSRSSGSIQRLVTYLREVNRALGRTIDDPVLDQELRDLSAAGKRVRRQPIRFREVRNLTNLLSDGVRESYTKAILWVLYDSQFRISSLLKTRLEDVKVLRPSGIVWLPPPASPVDWEHDGGFLPPSTACLLRDWFNTVGIVEGYLFPRFRRDQVTTQLATPAHARQIVMSVVRSVGNNDSISFRAIRQGAIADLFDAEVGMAKIMKHGRYKTISSVRAALKGSENLDGSSLELARHQDRWGEPSGY